jgi:hypothetical protein
MSAVSKSSSAVRKIGSAAISSSWKGDCGYAEKTGPVENSFLQIVGRTVPVAHSLPKRSISGRTVRLLSASVFKDDVLQLDGLTSNGAKRVSGYRDCLLDS